MAALSTMNDDVISSDDELSIDKVIQNDSDLQELAAKFDNDFSLDPDTNLNVEPSDNVSRDSDTASTSSSLKDIGDNSDCTNDNNSQSQVPKEYSGNHNDASSLAATEHSQKTDKQKTKHSKKKNEKDKSNVETDSLSSKRDTSPHRSKNPLQMLKRLTKFDKSGKSSFRSQFSTVHVDNLPQVFVAKYLGHREVGGVSGLHHVRKPVDEMIQQVRAKLEAKEEIGLPFLYVVVSAKGLDLREHPSNKVKGMAPLGVLPIDFISYGVQDVKYWRVFTCIVVRSLSWQSRSATCHAFLSDSAHTGRKMALALGAAFSLYAKKLKADGKSHNFQVDLRPPDEIAEGLAECEA